GPQIYRSEIDDRPPEQLALVGELRTGIDKDQLVVYYQPQFNMVTLRPVRVEALVRWMHPTRGLLSPGEFIPFIELGNLVELLTEKVLARAIADCRRWHRAGIHVDVAVNVPPRLLRHMDFAESVFAALDAERLPADALTLEVTESGLLSDVESALPVFEALRERGVRLSIDDFGTGYSSFTHLRRLPVDEIKIDRTFVSQMVENEEDAAIVRSTIDLGRSIGRTMVAEGVEDQETMQALLDLECDLAQGFLLAQPMTGKRFLRWIDERAAD
ncbi:MAG: EAL domain-containing protein, partial [Pseudomonadota bacterium]